MRTNNPRASRGFSLIELAVVLLIVVVMLTLGAGVVNLASENSALSQTRRKQEAIKDALTAYLGKYKRLPCPDLLGSPGNSAGTGDDNRTTPGDPATTCVSDVGVLPYIDLGLPRDFALDGWNNLFTYRVTIDADQKLDWARSLTFAPGKPGKLDVSLRIPATNPTPTPLTPAPEHAVVVLVSHGKNGLGAWTSQGTRNILPDAGTDERANADATATFFQREISDANVPTYGAFDDLVVYVRASELIAPLVKDGSVRSAEGETNYQIGVMSDDAIGQYITTTDSTVPATITPRTDGWGKAISYYRCTSQITVSSPATDLAFRIVSGGSNGTIGTTACATPIDSTDVVFDMPVGTLRTLYLKDGKTPP